MNNKTKVVSIIISISIFMMLVSCQKQKAEWKGTIEEVDGVTIVKNPKEPMYREDVFSLEEELSIGVVDGPETEMFSGVIDIEVDVDGNIYILDYRESCCRVFNPAGKFLRTIGSPGQGPGELERPSSLHICQDNQLWIADSRNRRIAIFTAMGKFLRNVSTGKVRITNIDIDSKGNIIGTRFVMSEDKNYLQEVQKFNSDMEYEFTLESAPFPADPRRKIRNTIFPFLDYQFANQDQIVYGFPLTYELKVYDLQGNLLRKIYKLYDPVVVPQETKEKLKKLELLDYKMVVSNHWPAYAQFRVDDKGWIYVGTYEKVLDNFCWDVFDEDGRYFARIHLNFSLVVIRNNNWYVLKGDEDGYQFVKRYKVTWKY